MTIHLPGRRQIPGTVTARSREASAPSGFCAGGPVSVDRESCTPALRLSPASKRRTTEFSLSFGPNKAGTVYAWDMWQARVAEMHDGGTHLPQDVSGRWWEGCRR
ncbi:hypothetical protein J7I84_01985 [Arthrobacter sp. ISL-85]|uniref:hypothetical protein n=1 Tax=Arthrobacter sp. ISL-85 TaxID=2819115 RepID=UPI001BE6D004|nr:hypothetical protein [Arthrobacter sp. ISL-85]MBT2565277.1 hypothetical protein [Arthrobacter sp. ISL-85]